MQATKEAEHREKLEELRARIADSKTKLADADDKNRQLKVCSNAAGSLWHSGFDTMTMRLLPG